jgi:hypothetical protein
LRVALIYKRSVLPEITRKERTIFLDFFYFPVGLNAALSRGYVVLFLAKASAIMKSPIRMMIRGNMSTFSP